MITQLEQWFLDSETMPLPEKVQLLHTLKGFRAQASDVINKLERLISEELPTRECEIAGFRVERRNKAKRAWDNHALLHAIAKDCTPTELPERLLELAAISYWRVGGLQALGLDADDFSDKGKFQPSIHLEAI